MVDFSNLQVTFLSDESTSVEDSCRPVLGSLPILRVGKGGDDRASSPATTQVVVSEDTLALQATSQQNVIRFPKNPLSSEKFNIKRPKNPLTLTGHTNKKINHCMSLDGRLKLKMDVKFT